MKKKKIEDPSFKIFPTKIDPVGGRKGEKGIDDIRPSGPSYIQSIEAHKNFCESLGNGTINPNTEKATKEAQEKFTESRIAGRSGRGERP
ncbi:MAG: hypothetical protein ACI4VP_00615 [Clostridia bacterium]